MSYKYAIIGSSGTGKSTAGRTLSPKTTYWINADGDRLPFEGSMQMYNRKNHNYLESSDIDIIKKKLNGISNSPEAQHIEAVIIDTVNACMTDDEMKRTKDKGFDKWMDLAVCVYELVRDAHLYRENLHIFFMFHEETFLDDDSVRTRRILTSGKKLQKIKLETKFTSVFYTITRKDDDDNNIFLFETVRNDSSGKTPMGMFKDKEIPNDLQFIKEKTYSYYNKTYEKKE